MSVFTPVSKQEAQDFLGGYALGDVESLEGIAAGVENTNYFLTTTTGEYVLTLFEKQSIEDLGFYLHLMEYLAENEFNCPRPQIRFAAQQRKELFGILNGKPTAIVSRIPGAPLHEPEAADCYAVGELLAEMHEIGIDFDMGMNNWRGKAWRESFAIEAAPKLAAAQNALIASENAFQAQIDQTAIPQGVIHGDLFRDNILWSDEGVPGVIDFYFACDDCLLYDIAITANDWCINPDATLDHARAAALLEGYQEVRAFEDNERALWPAMLRRAALRTGLGRLGYEHFPRDSHITHAKDHAFAERLLRHHIASAQPIV